jgi:hypothetical protein
VAVNGRSVSAQDYEDDRARRLVEREFNISNSAALPSNNTIIGRYTGGGDPALSNNVIISAGSSDIKLAINETDAVSFGGLSNYGTAGQVLTSGGTGAAPTWTTVSGGGGVAGVTGTTPITVNNTDPANPIVGVNASSTTAAGVVQLNDTVVSTSTTEAATANAVKTAYDLAAAAVPKSAYTAKGNLIVATAASTPTALAVGSNGQVLTANSACASGVAWDNAGGGSGTVTSITAGTGLTGGTITTSGTIALNAACVISPSAYTSEGTILIGAAGGGTTALSTVSNGRVLTSCSSCAGGVAWIAPGIQAMTPLTTTALTTVTLLSVNAATVRAIKLDLSITNTVTGKYFTDTIWVTHDGSNSNLATTVGARLGAAGGSPYTAGAAVTGGNLLITVTPAASSSTKFVGWYELLLI